MGSRRLRASRFRKICVCAASIAALALVSAPGYASAASPVLEFASPGRSFPIGFTAEGGEVTAVMANVNPVVHCADAHGEGEIIGPRSTVSEYVFTGCVAHEGGSTANCQSEPLNTGVIESGPIEADLVYIDQAKHEVGMLLNPGGGTYLAFKCGGELVEARGPFLAPVGSLNTQTDSFTASLSRSGAVQTPDEYENSIGEKRKAVPMGEWEGHPESTTGVELSFAIHTSAALEIKAVTAAEIEAKQREDEAAAAAAAKKRQEAEAAAAAAIKQQQAEEAALKKLREEQASLKKSLARARRLSKALKRCGKVKSAQKRTRCENRARSKYGGPGAGKHAGAYGKLG
jgi:hypothetical protein